MGITGTDVAKNAANIILCDDKFTTIVEAVKGGRGIFADYKKSGVFALSSNFGEVITMCLAVISGLLGDSHSDRCKVVSRGFDLHFPDDQ